MNAIIILIILYIAFKIFGVCRRLESWSLGHFISPITAERIYKVSPTAPTGTLSEAIGTDAYILVYILLSGF